MKGNKTTLLNLEAGSGEIERDFSFDYSFWSHDRFIGDSNGYNRPDGPDSPYAD